MLEFKEGTDLELKAVIYFSFLVDRSAMFIGEVQNFVFHDAHFGSRKI